jgi:hypothetical protein
MKPYFGIFELYDVLITDYTLKNYSTTPIWFDLPSICSKLNDLNDFGYNVVIITQNRDEIGNQKTLNAFEELTENLKFRPTFIIYSDFSSIVYKLNDMIVKSKESYKVRDFNYKVRDFIIKIPKDFPEVFLVGNKSGPEDSYPPYRYSDLDRRITSEIGAQFIRAIDFIGEKEITPPKMAVSRPSVLTPPKMAVSRPSVLTPPKMAVSRPELIITVGMPGSGKSYKMYQYAKKYGYDICDNDIPPYNTSEKCVLKSLRKNRSVINITTGKTNKERDRVINIAKQLNIPYRIVWFIRDGRPFNEIRGTEESYKFLKGKTSYLHSKPVKSFIVQSYLNDFTLPDDNYEIVF